ncbi:ABC transporter ATP-binding protein [Ornithinibacillus gellani]|uniref:ABC transporter ATP-binding protein n=1 Tax=Ornithinibacillus gellani TaxID=2293253 RepID=UPI000F48FB81|nr:ABC transporter ATP-binding protein [Ornithinibacillus gellani]TQS76003.1 ABC transporter ATP-binding protein [Ornithinibacillus gellani]
MENVIELEQVNKSYPYFQLKDVSLQVKRGFFTGFIGPNGAGKSTIIKLILHLIRPDSGRIRILGMDYQNNEKEIKEKIGFVYSEELLYGDLTLQDMKRIISPSYSNWDDAIFQQYREQFELPLRQKLKTFSKGMKMKVSLAIALSHHAELLIMDEPTAGLDPIFRREFMEILQEVMLDENKTILFSTHILNDLTSIVDYITLIQNGQILFSKESIEIEADYGIVRGESELLGRDTQRYFTKVKKTANGFEALTDNVAEVEKIFGHSVIIEKASLEEIMYYSREDKHASAY